MNPGQRRGPLEFVIFANGYDANVGGYVCLHYLCHLLNALGHRASLVPEFASREVSPIDADDAVQAVMAQRRALREKPYRVHPSWNTPIYRQPWRGIAQRDDLVVVYPEIIFGNPLRARHVARWVLNEPGVIRKDVYYLPGEVHFRYLEMHRAVPMPWIEVAEQLLTVTYIPWEHYQPPAPGSPREGTAYLVRKGAHKPLVHHPADAICVDGMSHAQIGEICRRVKTFVSYDAKTLYSWLAVLAGADSVVIPDAGVSLEQWQPDPSLRQGLAYGWDAVEGARAGQTLVRDRLAALASDSRESVAQFAAFWERRLDADPRPSASAA